MNFDVCILTTPHKRSLTAELLTQQKVEFKTYVNSDWPTPPSDGWDARHNSLEPKQIIAYRIFRGHQETMGLIEKDYGLILEDDAVPRGGWQDAVQEAIEVLCINHYEIVHVFGKAMNWLNGSFNYKNRTYLIPARHPSHGIIWMNGACAYVVSKATASKIQLDRYLGIPVDLHLPEFYKSCCSADAYQAFEHSYQYGSHFHTPIK